ncbi:DUF2213 domain-containing protein [Lysinibacillus macroides]|uniref:DUF2213 domain-containing protein n=1 Tax=Lysinibacillus macroides TaxID=33935 RepID=A0A0M9DJA0_9BACI|nr:DUF2213 domain-containing protein [Lysinibacillus macroides]KOY81566.1 hypothetical protein ADM90_14295 [Lysinibacillus macroides]QPR69591.1 DUF2213 domain-containing protein [Lysinibacillus macroides]
MKLQRYDRSLINDYAETSEGYLTVRVPITRPGVFPYARQDGTVQMEAKLPDEIFSDLTIRSARSKPITDEHPREPVTLDNYQTYAKGMSHTDVQVEDLKLYVSLTITDKDLIQKVHDGKREISIGFMSDVIAESGSYNGQPYEYVQRNIEINHIAIVEQGRAGPEVAIRADSDAWQIDSGDNKGGTTLVKYKINGKEYEIDPAVKAHIEQLAAATSTTDEDPEEEETEPEKKEEPKKKKTDAVDALLGRLDALEIKLQNTQQELADEKAKQMSADKLDKQVEARVQLISATKPLLGDSFDFTGKTDREIKEAVIATTSKDFKGDGKSDDYIDARFDTTIELVQSNGYSSTGANSMWTGDASQSTDVNTMRAQRLNMRD